MNRSMMAGWLRLWNEWEVEILVLFSFALQVFLHIFAGMRRRIILRTLMILLWLVYQLAELTATYTIGHMSLSCKPGEHRQLMALWAPLLLVHLGGQDSINAYSMEDNQLWLRHLLTLVMQTLGAAYVIYKYVAGSETMFKVTAVLIFLVGVIKYGERVWALKSSNLDSIIDKVYINQMGPSPALSMRPLVQENNVFDAEFIVQGAHDLLYICIGQFIDYPVVRSILQHDALRFFYNKRGGMYELIEMQLSLMHDIFYTKATVIYTRSGLCARAFSLCATVTAFFLFKFRTANDHGYHTVDVTVTFILLAGASLLEMASVLRAMGSSWTGSSLRARRWDRLHSLLVSLRRCFRAAQFKKPSGYIGQHNLLHSCTSDTGLASRMVSFWRNGNSLMISMDTKELVLKEIFRMIGACQGNEVLMRSYRGQCVLKLHGSLEDLTWSTGIAFDESILAWHFATDILLLSDAGPLVEATKAISNYMMFLLVQHPYMLPSPVRRQFYTSALKYLRPGSVVSSLIYTDFRDIRLGSYRDVPSILIPGATLAKKLLLHRERSQTRDIMLEVVLGVWVEMLCYAAHQCSRDSHARRLNNGGCEFITVVWLLTTISYHHFYYGERFNDHVASFFRSRRRRTN